MQPMEHPGTARESVFALRRTPCKHFDAKITGNEQPGWTTCTCGPVQLFRVLNSWFDEFRRIRTEVLKLEDPDTI